MQESCAAHSRRLDCAGCAHAVQTAQPASHTAHQNRAAQDFAMCSCKVGVVCSAVLVFSSVCREYFIGFLDYYLRQLLYRRGVGVLKIATILTVIIIIII